MSGRPAARPGRRLARPARRRWLFGMAAPLALGSMGVIALGVTPWFSNVAASRHASGRGGSDSDLFWKRADFADQVPGSIALLPAFSFDSNADRERAAGVAWAVNFGKTGYRWISATASRALLSSADSGDSLLRLARAAVLKGARVDSLLAPALCARLRVRSVLSLRIDGWDIEAIESNRTGTPWSRAYLRAALVDSLGRLLWTAEGVETVEGLYHEAQSLATGAESTAPHSDFAAGAGTPPPALDVFTRMLQRWAAAFPERAARAAP